MYQAKDGKWRGGSDGDVVFANGWAVTFVPAGAIVHNGGGEAVCFSDAEKALRWADSGGDDLGGVRLGGVV